MTPDEVSNALAAASAAFPAIQGRPLDDHCVEIENNVSAVLRQVDNFDEANCVEHLVGVAMNADEYHDKYNR